MLAFFGEYLARLMEEKEGVSSYSVVYEKMSAKMLSEDRVNVVQASKL